MPRPYFPYALWNYTPMITSVETPGIMSATEAPLICLQISQALVPYILGAVSLWTWRDKWRGESTEIDTAVGVMNDLIALIADGNNCPDCPEDPMPAVFRLTEECGLEYSHDNGAIWIPVPGWLDFAALCFTGPQGPPGATGETGPQGPPGEDGECPDCGNPGTRPSPEDTTTEDLEKLCGGAMGSVEYLIDILNYQLDQVEAHVGAVDLLINIFTLNFKETVEVIPVVGLIVTVIEGIQNVGVAQLRANVNNPDFKELVACELYCIVKRDGGLTQAGFYEWWDSLTLTEVLGALTDAGEYLKGVLTAMSGTNNFDPAFDRGYAAFSRRFAIAATNDDGSCELLCDCLDEPCEEVVIDWDAFGETPEEWTGINGTLDTSGWEGDVAGLAASNYSTTRTGVNTNWTRTGPALTALPSGVRYTLPAPCSVSHIAFSWATNTGNTKRVAIVVKRAADDVYEVLVNQVRLTIDPLSGALVWSDAAVDVTEIICIINTSASGTLNLAITENKVNSP